LSTAITPDVALELHEITKQFGDIVALDRVSLSVRRGRITALLGENGAGKTTLMRVAFGMIQPDRGRISVNGVERKLNSPSDAIGAGIGMVHQQFSLVPAMTVAENVALGGKGRFSTSEVISALADVSRRTGLELDPSAKVADLGSADRQKLEIMRTLAHDATLMILDEPTAVLTPKDVSELFRQLKSFTANGGAVVLITHKLADARAHADDVVVLRHGRVVSYTNMNEATEESLATAMLGGLPRETSSARKVKSVSSARVASLNAVMLSNYAHPVDLEIRAGEIVGIAALDEAATPLLRVLAGRINPISGPANLPTRIGFVPENRKDEALIADFSLSENMALANASSRRGLMNWDLIRNETSEAIRTFDVRTTGSEASPAQLSGGNQQRFVLGRELNGNPSLLVLENPTQGLDVNAADFVHERLKITRNAGAAVVFYSSDLDELADLSDRVLVVSRTCVIPVQPVRQSNGRAFLGSDGS
jgi:simple sugar transport system ATP-binding protein